LAETHSDDPRVNRERCDGVRTRGQRTTCILFGFGQKTGIVNLSSNWMKNGILTLVSQQAPETKISAKISTYKTSKNSHAPPVAAARLNLNGQPATQKG